MNLNKLVERSVPDNLRFNEDAFRRRSLFISSSVVSTIFLVAFGAFYYYLRFSVPAYVCFVLAVVAFVTLVIYIISRGSEIIIYLFGGLALLGMWALAETTGGLVSPSVPWLFISPFTGFLFVNRRYGIFLSLLMVLSLIIFYIIRKFDLAFLPYYNVTDNILLYSFVYLGLFLFLLLIIFFIYDKGIMDVYDNLKKANTQIGEKMLEIEETNAELSIQKVKAESSSQAKTQFLSAMSHEIRTPLNTVIGMSHILMQENPRPDQVDNLKLLKFSAEGLLALINDILDFNKIDAGKIDIEQVDFDLKDLINSIVSSQNQRAAEKNIELKSLIDNDIPEMVIGDPTRLGQILNNLIGNAVKFTDKGFVNVDVLLEKFIDRSYYIKFTIVDSGIGIPKDMLEQIFERFTQAGTYITRRFGGSGLGLAITKKLLELQNSRIYVDSDEGKGSRFYFTLQFKKSDVVLHFDPKNSSVPKQTFESLNGIKILLVEDNEANQIIALKFLRKWDLEVDVVNNGREACEQIVKANYNLVLMDLQMPVMDGYEAVAYIRKIDNGKYADMPIIALTASALMDVHDRIIITGMNDFITKPFNPNDLYNKVRKWSEKQ